MNNLFKIGGEVSNNTKTILGIVGFIILVIIWQAICTIGEVSPAILPSPLSVLKAFREIWYEDYMLMNIMKSLKLNLLGYCEALLLCIPLCYLLALIPAFNYSTSKLINVLRYLPLSAAIGLFIAWYGIGLTMKVQFLGFGIFVYLLPSCIDKVLAVNPIYTQTAYTLGATKWQMVKSVYFPASIRKITDDAIILIAISWTYIIMTEIINGDGIGKKLFMAARLSRLDKIFAWLVIIMAIGFLQDKLFKFIDRKIFPSKYN